MYVPLKDLFTTSQEHNGGRVTIGKNAMCKVVGIGRVWQPSLHGISTPHCIKIIQYHVWQVFLIVLQCSKKYL